MACTERCTPKASIGSSITGGRPYLGRSPRQAKSRRAVEYRPNETENKKCRRCTVLSWSTCNSANHSKPRTRSNLEARWSNKECTPHPDHFSVNSDLPSSLVTQNRANSASTRSSEIRPVPSTFPINRGGRRGQIRPCWLGVRHPLDGSITDSHKVCICVDNHFRDPAPRQRTKVKTVSVTESRNSCVFAFSRLLRLPTLPSSVFLKV